MGDQEGDSRVPIGGQQDETMMDVGLRNKPPDPPDTSKVWVEKVIGGSNGGSLLPGCALDNDFVRDRLQLEFPDGETGEPVITIGPEVLEAMNGLWKRCMIVKVLSRNVGISVLQKKLRELWKPSGGMFVVDLPRQFFVVRFEKEDEYLAALTGGPWRVFGSYLMVQAWSPDFDPLTDDIVTTPVWIRLLNIPMNFYHQEIIMCIARGLGDPLRVDLFTLRFERARYARVCVAVNLSKPLKGSVMVNGERYFVAYEGLPNICSKCGLYGHLVHGCPQRRIEAVATANAVVPLPVVDSAIMQVEENSVRPVQAGSGDQDAEGFTLVRRNGRNGKNPVLENQRNATRVQAQNVGWNLRDITRNQDSGKIVTENRFDSLDEDMVGLERRKDSDIITGNKEKIKSVANCVGQRIPMVFGASSGTGKNGPRVDNDPKGGFRRHAEKKVSKSNLVKSNRPGRGLIFGPPSGGEGLNLSGKRLRIDKDTVGRPGGVFTREGTENADGIRSENIRTESNELPLVQSEIVQNLVDETQERIMASSSPEMVSA